MTRGGDTTDLGDGVAFITAGTESNCVTNRFQDDALACLVKLTDPPPRPSGIETAWKDNWVDFAGTTVDVGSPHGDPGPFRDGTGAELPAGQTLAFGDYRCRADAGGPVLRRLRAPDGGQVERSGHSAVRLPPRDHPASGDRSAVQLLT